METPDTHRPDPDELLNRLRKEEEKQHKGKLKIFFGMCAGVGKTYEMLRSAHEALDKGVDVVVGYVEAHKRPETLALLNGLPLVPRKKISYRGADFEELDIDALLARKPRLVLVDELAHTNIPGSRHVKRYQDVLELLDNGIDVYTTVNVQHLDSRANTVAQITHSVVRETVPDSVFDAADEVEVIDIAPDELLKRLAEGKVYTAERSHQAIDNFFRKGNLIALREMSLRLTAERVDRQVRDYMESEHIRGPWKSGQRIVVGIKATESSANLIRWTRRMAYAMHASWIVVFVESSLRSLVEADKERLQHNFKLAGDLGAEIATTTDDDVAGALIRIAHQQKATQILVGKGRHRRWWRAGVVDQLISRSGDLDVYVVGGDPEIKSESGPRLPELHSGWTPYALAALIIGLVSLISFPVSPYIGYRTVSFVILLTVSLLPLRFGPGPVLLAAAIGALMWNFLFIPPVFTFSIGHIEDTLMFGMYFIIAIVTGVLSARVRARERAVRLREERATALYTLTSQLSAATSQDGVIQAAVSNIRRYFEADVAVFLSDPDGDFSSKAHPASTFILSPKELSVVAWVYWNEKKAGKFTDTLPFAEATYFPMSGPRYPLGVVGVKLRQKQSFNFDQETLLQNFLSQISSSIEREFLNELSKTSLVLAESERLYKTLFDSVSHELRTPITAIINATDNLERSGEGASHDFSHEIKIAASRLNRLVENLLDMTRLQSGMMTTKPDWVDVRDLIQWTIKEIQDELTTHQVVLEMDPEMPLIKIDFGLIQQAIVNLVRNAVQYTPERTTVTIKAAVASDECIVEVADNGPGVSPSTLKHLFDKFYRVPGTKAGGTGLGLSIAKGFVEAHQGTLTAESREGGGLKFTIRLPAEVTVRNSPESVA